MLIRKITNTLRCYASYALSLMGLVRVSHRPLFVSVEPADFCQLHCPECPVGVGSRRRKSRMSAEVWRHVLSEAAPYAWTMQFFFQGEPLLHPDLPQMIGEAHAAGLYTILSTNAQAMTPEMADALVASGLNRIIISMDGLTQAAYQSYRVGGDVDKCKQSLLWLHEAKRRRRARITVELQCLRLRTNRSEWAELKRSYRLLGADRLTLKTAQLYDYRNGNPLMPTEERYSRYRKGADGLYHLKRRRPACLRAWRGCVITTDGTVLPCCYDKAHEHPYGNILSQPLHAAFCSSLAESFRRAALRSQPAICQECWK